MKRIILGLLATAALVAADATKKKGLTKTRIRKLADQVCAHRARKDGESARDYEIVAKKQLQAAFELDRYLSRSPKNWVLVRTTLQAVPKSADRRAVRYRMLLVLSADADSTSRKIVAAELRRDSGNFPPAALVRLDRSGDEIARKLLIESLPGRATKRQTLAAMHLGFAGEKQAGRVLRRSLEETVKSSGSSVKKLALAAALARAGDPAPFERLVQHNATQAEELLKRGRADEARALVRSTEYFLKLVHSRIDVNVLGLERAVARHVAEGTVAHEIGRLRR